MEHLFNKWQHTTAAFVTGLAPPGRRYSRSFILKVSDQGRLICPLPSGLAQRLDPVLRPLLAGEVTHLKVFGNPGEQFVE